MAEKKVKVRVLSAVVDGHKEGEIITVEERAAKHLESIRYVTRVEDDKKGDTKGDSK